MGSRGHIPSPDGLAPPPGGYPSWDDYMHDLERTVDRRAYDDARRVGKAMRLATSLPVFEALLNGQQVPVSALDETWRRKYGL